MADLQNSEPLGYKHLVKIYPDKPHWMDTLDREAIPWMAEFERDPWPNKIIWRQDGVFQERFYWLEMPVESRIVAPQTYEQRTVATVEDQTIRVATSADPSITIRLSDKLVNLDEPITVIVNEKEKFKGLVPRSLNEIERSLAARPDPSSCSVASLTIGSGSIIEINSDTLIDSDLSYEILTKPKNGVLSGEAPNLVYTPNDNYSGSDSFSYKANNGTADSNTAIVTIEVVGKEKEEPVLILSRTKYKVGDPITISFSGGPGNKLDWIGIYEDGGDEVKFWRYVDGTTDGNTGLKSGEILMESTLPIGEYKVSLFLNDTFDIIVTSAFSIIQDIIGNTPPVVQGESLSVNEDASVVISLSGVDDDDDTLSFRVVKQPENGELSGQIPNLVYTPNIGFIGNDTIEYVADDGQSESNQATVFIQVLPKQLLPDGVYFFEDFNSLVLGPFESDTEEGGDNTDWTPNGPDGWVVRKGPSHGPTEEGEAVKEFDGWTFLDPNSWASTAGQFRDKFTKGVGVIAVADSDEYDDKAKTSFNSSLETPAIDISAATANSLKLSYDSSWRQEPQIGKVSVVYDGGAEIQLLKMDEGSSDGLNERIVLDMANPIGAKSVVVKWHYEGSNNWWWAIDNIKIAGDYNTLPTAGNQFVNVDEDGSVSITLDASDNDGDLLSYTLITQPKNGSLKGVAPDLVYTPNANYSGEDSFSYQVNDGKADSRSAEVTINISSINDRPMTYEKTFQLSEDESIAVILEGGDLDGDELSYFLVSPPSNGKLDGDLPNLTYIPDPNYFGTDSFSYKTNDGNLSSEEGLINLNILPINDDPTADDMQLSVSENGIVEINLSGKDIEGEDLHFSVVVKPLNGILDGNLPKLTYTPNEGFAGVDTFSYEVKDPFGGNDTAIVTINVTQVASPSIRTTKTKYRVSDPITISFSGGPGNKLDWIGIYEDGGDEVKFWRYVDGTTDGNTGLKSGEILMESTLPIGEYKVSLFLNDTFDIIVTSAFSIIQDIIGNTPPVVQGESLSVNEDASVVISLSGVDDDDDTLSFRVVKQPENGELSGQIPNLVYTPNIGFIGNDTIEYVADDGQSESNQATVFIQVLPKQLLPDGVYFFEDFNSLVLGPFESDTEEGGDNTDWTPNGPDGWVVRKGPSHGPTEEGEAVKEFDGWTFLDPNSWASTAGQFRDKFTKGVGVIAVADSDEYDDKVKTSFNSSLETPAIDISAATANSLKLSYDSSWRQEPQIGKVSVVYDGGAEIQLLKMDEGSSDGLNERIVLDMANPIGARSVVVKWHYQGSNNWWWAIDNIKVAGDYNTLPTAGNQSVNVDENGSVSITLDASDNDGDLLSYTLITQPKNGSLRGVAPDLVYTPNENYTGEDAFTYKVNDGKADSNVGSILINVSKREENTTLSLQFGKKSDAVQTEFDFWENISVRYYGGQGNSEDWIGVRMLGETGSFTLWSDLRRNPIQGEVHFGSLTPGLYEVVWINDGYRRSEARFRVLKNNDSPVNPSLTWTVFIYGNADHDLTPAFLKDIEEMKRANGNEFFNIVILSDLDGSEKTYSKKRGKILDSYGVKEEHKYKVTKGIILDSQHQIIEVMPEQDTDDAIVLEEFLDWGMTSYKADRYGVILWNHGGQWNGFGGDYNNGERYGDSKPLWYKPNMKSDEIKNAITNVLTKHDLAKLDFYLMTLV